MRNHVTFTESEFTEQPQTGVALLFLAIPCVGEVL